MPSFVEIKKFSGSIADKDIPVVVSAINGKADFLVTGDKKDFEKLKMKGDYPFKILSPSEFLDTIGGKLLNLLRNGKNKIVKQ